MWRRIPSAENLRQSLHNSLKTTTERIKETARKFPKSLEEIRSNGLKRGQLFTMKIYGTWTLYGTCFFLSAYFALMVILCLVIVTLLLFSPLLVYFLYRSLRGQGTPAKFGKDICERYENNLIASSIKTSNLIVYNDWINVTHGDESFHVHSVIINSVASTSRRSKKTIVWLHGVGGTGTISFILSGIANKLVDDFDIYCIDLPGFGRSTTPSSYKHATQSEIEEMMSSVIHEYIVRKGKAFPPGNMYISLSIRIHSFTFMFLFLRTSVELSDVFLIGHSFGAFHALNVAFKSQEAEEGTENLGKKSEIGVRRISRLLLVDPAGIMPMTGKDGTALAVLFKWGLPFYPLRSLGSFGIWLFYSILDFVQASDFLYYWFQVQAAPDCISDHLVAPFVTLNFYSAKWNSPLFEKFINLKIPVALGYGEADNISPPHQGIMLSALTGSTIPVYTIQDSWHLPMGLRQGTDFSVMVKRAFRQARVPSLPVEFTDALNLSSHNPLKSGALHGVFSLHDTSRIICHRQYEGLLRIRHSLEGVALEYPDIYRVLGDSVTIISPEDIPMLHDFNVLLNSQYFEDIEIRSEKQKRKQDEFCDYDYDFWSWDWWDWG